MQLTKVQFSKLPQWSRNDLQWFVFNSARYVSHFTSVHALFSLTNKKALQGSTELNKFIGSTCKVLSSAMPSSSHSSLLEVLSWNNFPCVAASQSSLFHGLVLFNQVRITQYSASSGLKESFVELLIFLIQILRSTSIVHSQIPLTCYLSKACLAEGRGDGW